MPQIPKLFHRRRSVTCIVTVRKGKDFSDALIQHEAQGSGRRGGNGEAGHDSGLISEARREQV